MQPTTPSSSAPLTASGSQGAWYQHAPARPPPLPLSSPSSAYAASYSQQAEPSRISLGHGAPNRYAQPPLHLQQPHHTSYPSHPQYGGYQLQSPSTMQQQQNQYQPQHYQQQQQQQQQQQLRPPQPYQPPMVSSPLPLMPRDDRLPNPYDRPLPQHSSSGDEIQHNGSYATGGSSRSHSSGIAAAADDRRISRLSSMQSGHSTSLSPALPPPRRPASSSSAGRASRQSSSTSVTAQQQQPVSGQMGHEFDDCPGCRSEMDEALAASLASARLDEERRKQREADEMQDVYAISTSEEDAGRRRAEEEERRMLEKVVEDSKKEAEVLSRRQADEEERVLEESRQAAQRERQRAVDEDQRQIEQALRASQADARKRAEAFEQEQEEERAAIAESMRQQEEEWKRRESEERSIIAFFEHQSRQNGRVPPDDGAGSSLADLATAEDSEDTEAEYWRFIGHSEAYDLAKKMKSHTDDTASLTPTAAGPSHFSNPLARRPLPPVPGQAAAAPAPDPSPSLPVSPRLGAEDHVPFSIIPIDAPPPYEAAANPDALRAQPRHPPGKGTGIGGDAKRSHSGPGTLQMPSRPDLSALQGSCISAPGPDEPVEAPSPVDSFAGPSPPASKVSSPVGEARPNFGARSSSLLRHGDRHSSSIERDEQGLSSTPPPPPPPPKDEGLTLPSSSPSPTADSSASNVAETSLAAEPASAPSDEVVPDAVTPSSSSLSQQQQFKQQSRGKKAIAGVDFGFANQPFATQLEKVHDPGDGDTAASYYFPNTLQLTNVTFSTSSHSAPAAATGKQRSGPRSLSEVGTRGTYFTIRAHSWKSLLRALAWYGNTRIEAGPEEVADAATSAPSGDRSRGKLLLRVEIEFVTPTKAEVGYDVGEYARNAASLSKPPAHVAICISLVPPAAVAQAFHRSAAYRASQGESKRLDAFYAGRGSARRLIYLPRQAPALPIPMVKLAQHAHLSHTFSAACPTLSHTARHSPRDLHHAIERHDEGYIKKQKALVSAAALLATSSSPSVSGSNGHTASSNSLSLTTTTTNTSFVNSMFHRPSIDTLASSNAPTIAESDTSGSHVNLMDSEHEDEVDFNNLALEDGGVEQVEALGKRARLKAKVKRRLGKWQEDGNVVDEDLATWITPFDVNEHD